MPLTKTPWHLLLLTIPNRSAPPLLVQSTFTSTTYTIHLTDLVNIWSESLSKREILARAERNSTAIDPSEDVSQLPILLEKLEYALGRKRDDDVVDVEILLGKGGLRLKTTIELPKPLGDLKWIFELKPVGGVQLVNLLVLPALSEVATLRDMVESLMTVVKEKDIVLERLIEGMGEAGIDVRTMVGGGRRRRGLEKFDVGRWRGEFLGGDRRAGEVVSEVFGHDSEQEIPGVKGLGGEAGEWWKGLDEDGEEEKERKPRKKVEKGEGVQKRFLQKPVPAKPASDTDDDEFEVQKTPPRASKRAPQSVKKPQSISPPPFRRKLKSPTPPRVHHAQDETASEDDNFDVGLPALRKLPTFYISKSMSPSKISPPPTKRVIGKIGGVGKTASPSPVPLDIPMADTEETGDEDDAWLSVNKGKGKEKETETNDDKPASRAVNKGVKIVIRGRKSTPELTHEEEKTAPVKKTIGKIGKIGWRKIGVGENMMAKGEDMAPSGSAVSYPFHKFGEVPLNDFQSRIPTPPLMPPEQSVEEEAEEGEDEDEKADRKRRQLQKELEAKKKAPVKKKRKF
ncbi:XLF-domain-containing protein [Choiromyces venosus 120613-1]|uniref:Non-homologous end-joining factor 1 n=1 Tax=Choiromyces venosus 120613-1 TaxID=1336337 RepID=A0A3N4JGQ7_9PEZI|nr:XLF-domain-containing protein [Choiromyces venosus 120613-1]